MKILKYRLAFRPKRNKKKIGQWIFSIHWARLVELPNPNQNISFSPRGAWQILAKSALGARSAPAEPAEGGRSLALNSEIFKMRYLLDEIRTFFTDNPDTDFETLTVQYISILAKIPDSGEARHPFLHELKGSPPSAAFCVNGGQFWPQTALAEDTSWWLRLAAFCLVFAQSRGCH